MCVCVCVCEGRTSFLSGCGVQQGDSGTKPEVTTFCWNQVCRSVYVCLLVVPAFMCNCPHPDCSDHWASILHFRGVISSTVGNSSSTSKRFQPHTVAELSFMNSWTAEFQMNLNKAIYQRRFCTTIIVEGFTGLYGLRIIRPPRRRKILQSLGLIDALSSSPSASLLFHILTTLSSHLLCPLFISPNSAFSLPFTIVHLSVFLQPMKNV